MNPADFAKRYEQLTDEELAAIKMDELLPDARTAYEAEMRRRAADRGTQNGVETKLNSEQTEVKEPEPFVCIKCKAELGAPAKVVRRIPRCPQGHVLTKVKGTNTPGLKAFLLGAGSEFVMLFVGGVLLQLVVAPILNDFAVSHSPLTVAGSVLPLLALYALILPAVGLITWFRLRHTQFESLGRLARGHLSQAAGAITLLGILFTVAAWQDFGPAGMERYRQTRNTLLVQACRDANLEAVRKLVSAGANVNVDVRGETPLQAALGNSCYPIKMRPVVELLLQKGGDANIRAYPSAYTPTMTAVGDLCPDEDIVKRLIAAGADVNAKGSLTDERTPLMIVAESMAKNKVVLAGVLLDAGAKVDLTNDAGDTALLLVAKQMGRLGGLGQFEMFDFLVSRGADMNRRNAAGETVLRAVRTGDIAKYPLRRPEYLAVVKHLQQAGVRD